MRFQSGRAVAGVDTVIPRRVLHVLATAKAQGAAIARLAGALARGLDHERYRVHAWFLGGDGPLTAELSAAGVPVQTFRWTGNRTDLVGALSFWRRLRGEHFSIVHLHCGGRALPFLVRSALRTRIVLHLHASGAESGVPGRLVVRPWAADRVIAVSEAVARAVVGARPHVVYSGVPIPRVESSRPHSGKRHEILLGTAGRLAPIKGLLYLIRAFASLRSEFPNVCLEVAGEGPEQTVLQEEARALGLEGCISFLGWQADVGSLFARWDVFVMPSLDEGLGLSALEAMAGGLPVVASTAGGLSELVEHGRTGWLVPPGNAAALAEGLRNLVIDPEQRRSMGCAGQARAREKFSQERMVAEVERIYEELLKPEQT